MNLHTPIRFSLIGELPLPLPVDVTRLFLAPSAIAMTKFTKALLFSTAAAGAAALVLNQLDLDAAPSEPDAGFPGPNPDDIAEEDVEMMLNELASQL